MRRLRRRPGGETAGTGRLEAFSDGVFAIAITLLILEIHLPKLDSGESGLRLRDALVSLWPAYFAYIFSFVTVGIYWANHHFIFQLYKKTDHVFNLLNIFFLMCISFLPLPTEALGAYMTDPAKRQTAVIFYTLGLLLPALGWFLCWAYASGRGRLIDPRLDTAYVARLTRQYGASILLYLLATAAAFWNGLFGLSVAVALTLFYLLPPARPRYLGMAD